MKEQKRKSTKLSIFYVMISFIIFAFVIVIYINNIIEVNNLSSESSKIKDDINKVRQTNDFLRTEIERLSNYDRIRGIAAGSLGMIYSDSSVDKTNILVVNGSELK